MDAGIDVARIQTGNLQTVLLDEVADLIADKIENGLDVIETVR